MIAQPIAVKVTRHKCPFCSRTAARPVRAREHMARCWYNPEARGCKTCKHFEPYGPENSDACAVGVDLTGRADCPACLGIGPDPWNPKCSHCGGDGREVKPGPIVHCDRWEAGE